MLKPIKIIWMDECDSTSRVLKELTLGRGSHQFEEPVVVSAGEQHAGVGRHGRTWQSLSGNLHYSIALPASYIAQELRDILPLVMGSLVANWIKKEFNVSPCLKWPNDILINGQKIGGLLCEGSYQGDQFVGAVIGLGLNLQAAPNLSSDVAYPVGTLGDYTLQKMSPKQATESFTTFLRGVWPALTRELALSSWQEWAIGMDQFWIKTSENKDPVQRSAKFYRARGISSAGYLRLEETTWPRETDPEVFEVSTINHDYQWSIQSDAFVLIGDVGNSMTKIARCSLEGLRLSSSFAGFETVSAPNLDIQNLSWSEFSTRHREFCETVSRWISDPQKILSPVLHAVAVDPSAFENLRAIMENFHVTTRSIERRPTRLLHSEYQLDQIGLDRLCLLEAVFALHSRGLMSWPVMCVSLGTATTVDMVDGAGRHLGGFICAGLQVSLDGIARRGAKLPKNLDVETDAKVARNHWPKNTNEAMARSPIIMTLAFLRSERARLAAHCGLSPEEVPVVLTGGFAKVLKQGWDDGQVLHLPDLVLLGAALLAINGR